jgi:hypothetical protein
MASTSTAGYPLTPSTPTHTPPPVITTCRELARVGWDWTAGTEFMTAGTKSLTIDFSCAKGPNAYDDCPTGLVALEGGLMTNYDYPPSFSTRRTGISVDITLRAAADCGTTRPVLRAANGKTHFEFLYLGHSAIRSFKIENIIFDG